MKIITKKEAKSAGLKHYYTGKQCKYGHFSTRLISTGKCGECHKQYHQKYIKDWQKNNKEKVNESTKKWREKKPSDASKSVKLYYANNKKQKLLANKKWREENPDVVRYYNANRRALLLEAKPSWANDEKIKQIYKQAKVISEETGIPHHVDHIIPLKHELVCGLHCEANLQIIPAKTNMEKGNTFMI